MGRAASFSDAETTNRPCRVQSYGSNLQHETCNQHPGCQRADQGSRIGALCPLSVPNSSPTTPLTPTTGHLPPFPGSPIGANALCFPTGIGLPHNRRGSASSPDLSGFIPHTGSPSYSRLHSAYEAASFVFVLRPAGLAGIPDWVRPACMACQPVATPCRGKFRPVVTSRTRPQPTYPKGLLVW